MRIQAGYEIAYDCARPTPMLLMLRVHPSRQADLETPERITFDPPVRATEYKDGFGNLCTRITAPPGRLTISNTFVIRDGGEPDLVVPEAEQQPLEELPDHVLVFLLGSRYCDTDCLMEEAWSLFGQSAPAGRGCRPSATTFMSGSSSGTSTRLPSGPPGTVTGRAVACVATSRHLAITFCRCLNIPARYCTGYLGDIGVPADPAPMDFSAWFEVYLSGQWYTFDARHNLPRVGRILMGRGRDATDVALSTSFGRCTLAEFKVTTDEVI